MSTDELACTYAALILHDEGLEITADKITSLTKAASVDVEGFYPALFSQFLQTNSLGSMMTNVGGAGAPAPVAAAGGGADAGGDAPAEEKKAAPEEESDEGMDDFGLFD